MRRNRCQFDYIDEKKLNKPTENKTKLNYRLGTDHLFRVTKLCQACHCLR